MTYITYYDPDTESYELSKDMRDIYDYYDEKGLRLSPSVIARYALSLRTKPFIILSGISGTGKTKIAQLFAEYMLQDETEEEKEKRLAFVSVRPDWTDNRGLLGYYNLLDQRYYTTKVLRLLIEAGKHPEKPYFIILDEMNLAKVEHYFSDFLSVMESRTAGSPKGERIELHGIRNRKVLAIESTEADPILVPAEIHISNNVYFTGTVNVDETTYLFSPKVVDAGSKLTS